MGHFKWHNIGHQSNEQFNSKKISFYLILEVTMRRSVSFLALSAMIFAISCSPVSVSHDYDPDANFGRLKSARTGEQERGERRPAEARRNHGLMQGDSEPV